MRKHVKAMLVGLLVLASPIQADKKVRVPQLSDLATAWLGGGLGFSLEYARLELNTDGKGVLVVQYLPDRPPKAYRVVSTRLSQYAISFALQPLDPDAEPIFLRGQATPAVLELEMGGAGSAGWSRKVVLEHEQAVLDRIAAVTARAAALRGAR